MPLLLFNYVGFELQNGAAEEMEDPQHDVPISVIRSGIIGVLLYAIPIFGILVVLPPETDHRHRRLPRRGHTVFSVYGGAQTSCPTSWRSASSSRCSRRAPCG